MNDDPDRPVIKIKPMPTKSYPCWFGLDSMAGRYITGTNGELERGLVAPGEAITMTEWTWIAFKSERMFVKSDCAPSFLIRQVFVGQQRSMSVNQNPIIAEPFAVKYEALAEFKFTFGEPVNGATEIQLLKIEVDKPALDFIGAPFSLPTLPPGLHLTMVVENIGTKPTRFLGALVGQGVW